MFLKRIWHENGRKMETLRECKKVMTCEADDGLRITLSLTLDGGPIAEMLIERDSLEGVFVMNDDGKTIEIIRNSLSAQPE